MNYETKELINLIVLIAVPTFIIGGFVMFKLKMKKPFYDKIYLDELNQKKYCVDCVSCKSYLCRNIRSIYHKDNVKDLFACRLYNERRV